MKRVLNIVRMSFSLLAACGILSLWIASFKFGREATVWGFAGLFPGTARVTVAEALDIISTPLSWIENGLGVRFGGRASLAEAVDCLGKRADSRQQVRRCIRDVERYIPMARGKFRPLLFWKENGSCAIQLENVAFDQYVPTQISVQLRVDASAKHLFAVANGDNLRPGILYTYQLDADGCEFAVRNRDDYDWSILYMKGFANDLDKAS